MPRKARLDAPGSLHHVIIRGIDDLQIFRDAKDRLDFLLRTRRLVKKTGTRVLAWVLMETHVHLLLLSGPRGLPNFMRCLLTGYALSYNRRYERRGHLFQNRYKSILCEEESYLLELVRYIHLNPVRAGVLKTVDELDRYPWSGHCALVGWSKNDWQTTGYILKQFSEKRRRAIQLYRTFLTEGLAQGKREDLAGGGLVRSLGGWSQVLSLRDKKEMVDSDTRILGSSDFVTGILQEADMKLKRQLRLGERQKGIGEVLQRICAQEGVMEMALRNGGRKRKVSKARARICYSLSYEFGVPAAEIARNVGVATSAVTHILKGFEREAKK